MRDQGLSLEALEVEFQKLHWAAAKLRRLQIEAAFAFCEPRIEQKMLYIKACGHGTVLACHFWTHRSRIKCSTGRLIKV